ncbi:MAG: sigma-54 dependent transcriptional regulator [Candidatus Wallbacteria bacterium]
MALTKKNPGILIIDDEESILYTLNLLLTRENFYCELANSGEEGIKKFRAAKYDYDIIITDLLMPGIDGMQILKTIKELRPECSVIMMTAHGNTDIAVKAIKEGAYYYISKPFTNDEIKMLVRRAFNEINLKKENLSLRQQLSYKDELIGNSDAMLAIKEKITKVSVTDATVLITGESGTGKELVARAIHYGSGRHNKNFVTINCAAIPADLLENELFGHEKGAYSGAHTEQKGKFELADGGTLFLDEVGDMPLQLQAKVLRAIQEQVIERLGGTMPVNVNVRIIAATNKKLDDEILKKAFREDLYYRLNVIKIEMPPLRERKSDIEVLIRHFLKMFSQKLLRNIPVFENKAMDILREYSWPGNIRQLKNTIERILVLCSSEIISYEAVLENAEILTLENDTSESSEMISESADKNTDSKENISEFEKFNELIENDKNLSVYKLENIEELSFYEAQQKLIYLFEKDYLSRMIKKNGGNVSKTAQKIGIHRVLLHEKIKKLNIDINLLRG